MMPMHFFFSDKVILLFDFWDVHSPGGMVLSVFLIMLLTVIYEGIKVGKAKLIQHSQTAVAPSISQENLREGVSMNSDVGPTTSSLKKRLSWHLAETFLHMVQVFLGYLVMLAVMTYNTWIFLGVIAGSAIGYFVAYPLLCLR
ncbi:probable low affinity copper uptake protein 2 isoform X1 [Crotalus tigris]|uniref:probable low affinity copper uptake protein 2 isoform X1 n=2 Tax=Crotalus tigris TaxID=88082 RepID=UPI00192F8ABB|nr:probable low affinity copper uptake protein 2 isoform X1 [Crotalus tigris]